MRAPRPPQDNAQEPSYIYAIQSGEFIKVGLSRNVDQRLRAIISLNPHGARVRMKLKVNRNIARGVEKHLHEMLAEWLHYQEWFTAPIETIREYAKVALREGREVERRDYEAERRYREKVTPEQIEQSKQNIRAMIDDAMASILAKQKVERESLEDQATRLLGEDANP